MAVVEVAVVLVPLQQAQAAMADSLAVAVAAVVVLSTLARQPQAAQVAAVLSL